jgi:hypothetical protein
VDWGAAGIRHHAPDLAVFRGVRRPPPGNFGTFRLRDSGGRCVLGVEIVSPHTRENDVVHKFREYHAVGMPLYVLIDQETEDGPREVVAHRYTRQRYVRVRPDRQGRLLLKPLGLWLGLEEERAVCWDAETGERLGEYTEIQQAGLAEREACLAAEQRIRELEAELRRARGQSY